MTKIKITINGKEIELENSSNIAQMIQERGVCGSMFVVERNHQVVPKENYETTEVKENDCIEIVGFFGGG